MSIETAREQVWAATVLEERARITAFMRDCISHADEIYVRDKVGGKWDAYKLSELPAVQALEHVLRWIGEGRLVVHKVHKVPLAKPDPDPAP